MRLPPEFFPHISVQNSVFFTFHFKYAKTQLYYMAKKSGGRLVSSAGLVTYYDSEDRRAVHIAPTTVMIVAGAIAVLTIVLNVLY
jgi:preprotein translocase subunit Sec61beta